MILNRRFKILKHWLAGRRNGVSLSELLRHLLTPLSKYKAAPFINRFREEEDYIIIHFKKFVRPLYVPRVMKPYQIWQIICEIFLPTEWHYYEIPQTAVTKDDIVADCGAAEGLFSLSVIGRAKKIYAIEPLPVFIKALKKSFGDAPNFEIIPAALGAQDGELYMSDEGTISSLTSSKKDIKVRVARLDSLFYDKQLPLTYIKADLEGYEMEMLQGASSTIKANRPKIAITTYHRAEHAAQIEKFLKSIHPDYHIKTKGLEERAGAPVMLHAW